MRALAIGSLVAIAHESVFPAILIGMADETREVRAAAARAMSRLNFDRAAAYTRVMESAGDELLGEVASACLRSGIVSQNLDRLSSTDRRQVYEAFSLISLLAKAGMFEAIIDAISSHESVDVRSMAIHLLAATGEPAVFERFKELAVNEDLPEDVKTALLEALYKQEQSKPKEEEAAPEIFWVDSQSDIETVNEESAEEPDQPTAIDPEFETHSFSDQHALLDERDF
jgi:HEAT repeat protein